MTSAPFERRIDGLRSVNDKWSQHYVIHTLFDNRHEVAKDIRALTTLGRTVRWIGGIEAWAHEMEDTSDPKICEWAFIQYGIYAGYAA